MTAPDEDTAPTREEIVRAGAGSGGSGDAYGSKPTPPGMRSPAAWARASKLNEAGNTQQPFAGWGDPA